MAGFSGAARSASGRRRDMIACLSGSGCCTLVGNSHLLSLRAAAGGVCRAWRGGRAHSLERRQATGNVRHDGIPGALGAAAELARDGAGISNQLGSGVSVRGMVCAVGPGEPRTAASRVDGALWAWWQAMQLPIAVTLVFWAVPSIWATSPWHMVTACLLANARGESM